MKTNFGYEDIRSYLLNKLSDTERIELENALKNDVYLQNMLESMKERFDIIKKNDEVSIPEEDIEESFSQFNIITYNDEPFEGSVWYLKNHNYRVVVLTSIEDSYTGKDVRVIPLSEATYFAQPYDVVFTNKEVWFRPLVAHIHLVTNVLIEDLINPQGNVGKNLFYALEFADEERYSELDYHNASFGKGVSEENLEPFEIWQEEMREILSYYRDRVFQYMEENQDEFEKVKITTLPKDYFDDIIPSHCSDPEMKIAAATTEDQEYLNEIELMKNAQELFEDQWFVIKLTKQQGQLFLRIIHFNKYIKAINNVFVGVGGKQIYANPEITCNEGIAQIPIPLSKENINDFSSEFTLSFSEYENNYAYNFKITQ